MTTISAPFKQAARPSPSGEYPVTYSSINIPSHSLYPIVSSYSALGVDVADISGDTWSALDIVEGQVAHARVELEEERQRLADATTGAEDDDLGEL
jgi:hypothetical protein